MKSREFIQEMTVMLTAPVYGAFENETLYNFQMTECELKFILTRHEEIFC